MSNSVRSPPAARWNRRASTTRTIPRPRRSSSSRAMSPRSTLRGVERHVDAVAGFLRHGVCRCATRAGVVFSCSLTTPVKPAPPMGFLADDDHCQQLARCPIECPNEGPLSPSEKKRILLECGIAYGETRTRTGDTTIFSRGAGIPLTTLKNLQFRGISTAAITSPMFANCGRLSRIWALGCGSVPNGFPANSGGACPNQRRVGDLQIHSDEMMNA
jgi:hypothetical protein